MIIKTLEGVGNDRIRDREIIPRLSERPRVDRDKPTDYFSTQPFDWLTLLNKLPLSLKSNLGTVKFSEQCHEFFSAICQHAEYDMAICENCGQLRTVFGTEGFKQIRNFRYADVSVMEDRLLVTREMIIGSDFSKSKFLSYTALNTNWWDNNVPMSHASFLIIPPEID